MKVRNKILCFIFTVIIIIFAAYIRFIFIDVVSGDYLFFLSDWYHFFELYGLKGLGFYQFDYAPLYVTFLAIFSYIPISHVIITRLFSFLFEILLAVLIYKYLSLINKNSNRYKNIILASLILLAPTLILNSLFFCQCDVIYTFFVILALYFYEKGNINKAFISLGTAFSFKLQFIFIIPVFIILFFRDKRIKWFHFFYIPLMNLFYSIPSFMFGFTLKDLLNVYLTQTSEYSNTLRMNISNIYCLFDFYSLLGNKTIIFMSIFTVVLFSLLLLYCILRKVNFNNQTIFDISILSVLICTLFLPCMHDRYIFMADILSIIYVLIYKKCYIQAMLINFVSLTGILVFYNCIDIVPPGIVISAMGAITFVGVTLNQFIIFSKHINNTK
jgi:Gpi18-like mannosyltransferase